MQIVQSRRDFLKVLARRRARACSLGPGIARRRGAPGDDHDPPVVDHPICFAPIDIATELLRAEGFTDVRYIPAEGGFSAPQMVASGDIDFGTTFAGSLVFQLDAGLPLTAIGGLHAGCYELFAREAIHRITDLKGQRVGIQTLSSSAHLYLSIMAAYVGLDPQSDINWVMPRDRLRRWSRSPQAKPTPFSASRPSHRSCGRAASTG